MASDDYPLIDNPHAPTRLTDSESANTSDFYPSSAGAPPTPSSSAKRHHHNKRLKPNNFESSEQNNTNYLNIDNNNSNEHTANANSRNGEYRKDREEWSDVAILRLLEAYTEKYKQLNRGNLRGRDWEEVAELVSEGNGKKSVEQCKNKIDNLKKRYKVEMQRIGSSGGDSSWHWFKYIEGIVGHSSSSSGGKGGGGGGGSNVGGGSVESDVGGGGGVSVAVSGSGGGGGSSGANGSLVACRQTKRYTPANAAFVNNMKVKPMPNLKWKRVVFKISGSALAGNSENIDPKVAMQIAREVASACRIGLEVAIVLGGRNFFCGETWISSTGLERTTAYQIGMMATVMNSILLQSALEKLGVQSRVQSAFAVPELAELYSRQRAIRHLEKGRVVIFGGVGAGAGNPLFTTDTAAALRASELNADALLKGTNIDGIYDCQSGNSGAILDHVSFREAVSMGITSMDVMAITYCEENEIPVVLFNLQEPGNISRALCGDQVGTLIDQDGRIN